MIRHEKPSWLRANAVMLSTLMLCLFMFCLGGLMFASAPSADDTSFSSFAMQQQTVLLWMSGALGSLFASIYFASALFKR